MKNMLNLIQEFTRDEPVINISTVYLHLFENLKFVTYISRCWNCSAITLYIHLIVNLVIFCLMKSEDRDMHDFSQTMLDSSAPNVAARLLFLKNFAKALLTYWSASFTAIFLLYSRFELLQKYSPFTAAAKETSSLWNSDICLFPSGPALLSGRTSGNTSAEHKKIIESRRPFGCSKC